MIFRTDDKEYVAVSAVEIVSQLAEETAGFTARTSDRVYEFLQWSLDSLSDRLPLRELDLSARVSDEILARSYLSLRHQYGIGQIIEE